MNFPATSKTALAAAFLLAGGRAFADDMNGYEFPTCMDERGEQVAFIEDYVGSGTMVMRMNVRYMDADNLEQPTILYDRDYLESIPAILRDFGVAHECYHFSSGDARYAYNAKPEKRRLPVELHKLIEDNANCAAAHALREEYDYIPEDLDRLEAAIDEFVSSSQAREDMPVIQACFRHERPMPVPVLQTIEHQ